MSNYVTTKEDLPASSDVRFLVSSGVVATGGGAATKTKITLEKVCYNYIITQ